MRLLRPFAAVGLARCARLLACTLALLIGDGARRQRRLRQQQLFKQEAQSIEMEAVAPSDESIAAVMDEEMLQEA